MECNKDGMSLAKWGKGVTNQVSSKSKPPAVMSKPDERASARGLRVGSHIQLALPLRRRGIAHLSL